MKLYNTPHKQVELIEPRSGRPLSVYTCGPTVYDEPHIGNWFTFLRYDLLVRVLRDAGYEVNWVMNITDVGHLISDADEGEDKLEKGARREGKTAWQIADHYTRRFLDGLDALNILKPDSLPKATDHIQDQIDLVSTLEAKGFTYVIDDGVYFDTSKFDGYADFAQLDVDGLTAGARVNANPQKRNITDFALWKFSPVGSQRDMEWDSPWGKGFPGWHLECSAMSMKYLGETLDIHGGGIDHIPVHHTNEIAQSQAATGLPFSRHWFHANHITVEGQKIAKSAGNGVTLADIAQKGYRPDHLRMLALESHYRTQSVFSWEALAGARQRLNDLEAVADWQHQSSGRAGKLDDNLVPSAIKDIRQALQNDLSSPQALSIVSRVVGEIESNDGIHSDDQAALLELLKFLDGSLGFKLSGRPDITHEQKQLLEQRQAARQQQNWEQADQQRQQLLKQGIAVKDTATGYLWQHQA